MWSKALQEQTREFLKKTPTAMMKQVDGRSGICMYKNGLYTITDITTKEKYIFDSIDALLEAKWVID